MVADHLVRLLERHYERFALAACRNIEAVQLEIVAVEADVGVLEAGQFGKAAMPGEQAIKRGTGKGGSAGNQLDIVRCTVDGLVETVEEMLIGILRGVE